MDNVNPDYMRADHSVVPLGESGIADHLFQNNKFYKKYRQDGEHSVIEGNIKQTFVKDGSKRTIHREQLNIKNIATMAKYMREQYEAGQFSPLDPLDPSSLTPKLRPAWTHMPVIVRQKIENEYFGGMPFDVLKKDKTLWTQWYKVIQREYPAFITYPGGVLPLPEGSDKVPYPSKTGERKYFGDSEYFGVI